MKKNNKGYSLIELVVSSAIMAILSLGVAAFISYGMRVYNDILYSIKLQSESQLIMNQVREYVVDCSSGIAWVSTPGTGDGVLYVVNRDTVNPNNQVVHIFRYVSDSATSDLNTIYYGKTYASETLDAEAIATDKMAGNISELGFTVRENERGAMDATMSLQMTINTKVYQASQVIALRNHPAYADSWHSLWNKVK